jgi:uroporphyrinogen-III decarboxylase
MGLERWIETLLTDPETADRAIRFTQPFIFSWASALQKAGVTGLVITEPLATSEMLPRTMFESMILPRLHDCFSQMEGPLVLHHTGGSIGHVLDLLPGLPHLAGVSVGCRDDLVKARRSLGPDLLLLGNLDNILFAGPAVAEIRARSLECLRTAAPAGRFILCNSGGDIPWSCPQENLQAMIDATVDYAREAGGG